MEGNGHQRGTGEMGKRGERMAEPRWIMSGTCWRRVKIPMGKSRGTGRRRKTRGDEEGGGSKKEGLAEANPVESVAVCPIGLEVFFFVLFAEAGEDGSVNRTVVVAVFVVPEGKSGSVTGGQHTNFIF